MPLSTLRLLAALVVLGPWLSGCSDGTATTADGSASGTGTESSTDSMGTDTGASDSTSGGSMSGGSASAGTDSGGTMSGGTVSGGTVSGGTMSGGTVSGGTMSGGTMSGGTMSGGTAGSTGSVTVTDGTGGTSATAGTTATTGASTTGASATAGTSTTGTSSTTGSTTGGGVMCQVDPLASPQCGDGVIAEGEVCFEVKVPLVPTLTTASGEVQYGDWNSDGHVDLFAGNWSQDGIQVFMGDGTGEFFGLNTRPLTGGRNNYYAGNVAIGDLDDDGDEDVATADYTGSAVRFYRNNGFGGLTLAQTISTTNPVALAVADFNGDTNLDLVIAGISNAEIWNGSQLGMLTGPLMVSGAGGYQIAAADLDGNGEPDLVAGYSSAVRITRSNPGGAGFLATATVAPGSAGTVYGVGVAQMDKMGGVDIVAIVSGTADHVAVLTGDGSGGFTHDPMKEQPLGNNPWDVAIADLNGDTWLDVAVVHDDTANELGVLLNNQGTSILAAMSSTTLPGTDYRSIEAADIDDEGSPDLLVQSLDSDHIVALINDGGGVLVADPSFTVQDVPCGLAVGDLTGDGIPDLVNNTQHSTPGYPYDVAQMWFNDGGGTFAQGWSPTLADPEDIVVADFDNDGDLDLASTRPTSSVYVTLGNGRGGFGPSVTTYAVGTTPRGMDVGHFNADAFLDLVVTNEASNFVSILPGLGTGAFGTDLEIQNLELDISGVAVGRFDGDAMDDFVTANQTSNEGWVFLRTGNYAFTNPPSKLTTGLQPEDVVVADLNNDTNQDLVFADYNWNRVSVFLGNGNGTFAPEALFDVGMGPWAVDVLDVDADGLLDIVTANRTSDDLTIIRGNGSGSFDDTNPEILAIGGDAYDVLAVDVDGDCMKDLIVTNQTSDALEVFLSNP